MRTTFELTKDLWVECTDEGRALAERTTAKAGQPLNPSEVALIDEGIDAGVNAALYVLALRGYLRTEALAVTTLTQPRDGEGRPVAPSPWDDRGSE